MTQDNHRVSQRSNLASNQVFNQVFNQQFNLQVIIDHPSFLPSFHIKPYSTSPPYLTFSFWSQYNHRVSQHSNLASSQVFNQQFNLQVIIAHPSFLPHQILFNFTILSHFLSLFTGQPSSHPSGQPRSRPSSQPSRQPSRVPSVHPSVQPTARPTAANTVPKVSV